MSISGFFLLLAIVIVLRFIGNKLMPVLMPSGQIRTIATGWLGALVGSLVDGAVWKIGPNIAGVNLAAAILGCLFFLFLLGIAPFIKIMLGKA